MSETTHLGYAHGDLVSLTDPLGRTTRQFVDSLGRVTSITSPEGRRTRYTYDEDGNRLSQISPSGAKTSFEYDADGNLSEIIDPRGNETTRAYDVMDRLESETDPLVHTAEWKYNEAGDLAEYTDRNGKLSTFSYDPLRRLAKVRYGVSGLSAESTITYEHDEANRLICASDSASGEYKVAYNGLNLVESVEASDGAVSYAYDAAGNREVMLVSGQEPTIYSFDDANQLTGLSRGGESVSLSYDDASRPEAITLPDGVEERYGYDSAGAPTSISYTQGEEAIGDLDYAYNEDGELEAEWGSYARTSLPEALVSTEYNKANELAKREGKELVYDKNGNLTSGEGNAYSWNARNQLTAISGETPAAFGYDPFGRRASKTLGGTMTAMLYDGANVVQESVEESEIVNLLTGLRPDQLFSRATEAGADSYLTDRLGSTIALATESGEVETAYTYDPFGASSSSGAPSDNAFQFTGRENDENGLQFNRARYYDPDTARFISPDPTGLAGGGINLYWYALGDPLDFTDASGRCVVCVDLPNPVAPLEDAITGAAEDAASQVGDWVSKAGQVLSETLNCKATGVIIDLEGVPEVSTGVVLDSTGVGAPVGSALIVGGELVSLTGLGFDALGEAGIC